MQSLVIILAIVGAIVIVSLLGMWLMHATMMGGSVVCCGTSTLASSLPVLLLITGIAAAIYLLIRRGNRH